MPLHLLLRQALGDVALSDKSDDYLHRAMTALAIRGQHEHIAVPTELVSAYLLVASAKGMLHTGYIPVLHTGYIRVIYRLYTGYIPPHSVTYRYKGDLEAVQELATDSHIINMRGKGGRAPLHAAAETGQIGIASTLLKRGAEPNMQCDAGSTALHLAAAQGHAMAARILMRFGASTDVRDAMGRTPFDLATAGAREVLPQPALLELK